MASWYTDVQCLSSDLAYGPLSDDECGTLSVRLSLNGIKWYLVDNFVPLGKCDRKLQSILQGTVL